MTSVSKQYLSDLEVSFDIDCIFHTEYNNDLDDGNIDVNEIVAKLQLDSCYNVHGDAELEEWFSDIKHNSLKYACRIAHLLHSLDQCKECFCKFVQAGNE